MYFTSTPVLISMIFSPLPSIFVSCWVFFSDISSFSNRNQCGRSLSKIIWLGDYSDLSFFFFCYYCCCCCFFFVYFFSPSSFFPSSLLLLLCLEFASIHHHRRATRFSYYHSCCQNTYPSWSFSSFASLTAQCNIEKRDPVIE